MGVSLILIGSDQCDIVKLLAASYVVVSKPGCQFQPTPAADAPSAELVE
jgi:hypothetical protein